MWRTESICLQFEIFEPTKTELSLKSSLSNKALNRIGETLISAGSSNLEIFGALMEIEGWRASYSLPLRATYLMLRKAALGIDHRVIVSRRLKRMESIIAKLERAGDTHGKLSTIQDIGGCRVVFPLIDQLGAFANVSKKYFARAFEDGSLAIRDNYILEPKVDGYRGIHAVLRYKANNQRHAEWDGRKIEIQVRTQIQHSWATALETVDLFSSQKLKWGQGDPKWQRFFTLASAVFAHFEGTPKVPGTPRDVDSLREEIGSLWHELDVLHKLTGWSRAVSSSEDVLSQRLVPPLAQPASTFLVIMDINKRELRITPYSNEEMTFANEDYAKQEQRIRDGYDAYAVLVSVEGVKMLREAYPNFYADTDRFVLGMRSFLGERGIDFAPMRAVQTGRNSV
jgi:hypothetical protein